ncbi:MAG: superoxide dismutase [Chlamydiae bacterium]|nr:superoxide dismutase [Chlamydiota bacterium]
MPGFSDKALSMHFTLYKGYVKTTNAFLEKLEQLRADGRQSSLEFAEFKRRVIWDYDGMRLHELYFENLGGHGTKMSNGPLAKQIEADFGSIANWIADFKKTGALRGVGWVVLYKDPKTSRLVNAWIAEHDKGHLAGGNPILIMDVWEHAYMVDYGLDRKGYIEAFFNNINWPIVEGRF